MCVAPCHVTPLVCSPLQLHQTSTSTALSSSLPGCPCTAAGYDRYATASCQQCRCIADMQVEVAYKNITEIRTAPRAFGLWGDCVIFLKDGSRLEITGLERHQDIKRHILSCIHD